MKRTFTLALNLGRYTFPGVRPEGLFAHLLMLVDAASQSGFDAFFVMDHFRGPPLVGPPSDPVLEAYVTLGALAVSTRNLVLGAFVTPFAFRNPAILAKQVTTLDALSGGRAILGIGSGGFEDEHRAYGAAWGSDRWERLDESVEICKRMFRAPTATWNGRHYSIAEAYNVPRPLRPGGIPVMIAGVGVKKLMPIVARHADVYNAGACGPDRLANLFAELDRQCATIGRNPAEIEKTYGTVAVVGKSRADALARADDWVRADRTNADAAKTSVSTTALLGGPDEVTAEVHRLREAGMQGLVVTLGTAALGPEDVAEMGVVLSKAMS